MIKEYNIEEIYRRQIGHGSLGMTNKFFKDNELQHSKYVGECYLVFMTAPHCENQMMVIDLEFNDKVDESINKEKIELEWKEFISVYFDRQLKEIIIKFISLREI